MAKKSKKKKRSSGIVASIGEQPLGRVLTWTAFSTIALAAVEGLVQKYLGKTKN